MPTVFKTLWGHSGDTARKKAVLALDTFWLAERKKTVHEKLQGKAEFTRTFSLTLLFPSCFVPGMIWLLPFSFVLDVLILWAKLTLEEF